MPRSRSNANADEVFGNDPSSANEIELELEEAFLVILLLANEADGEVAPEETQALAVALERMHIFKSLSNDQIEDLFEQTVDIFNQYSSQTIFAAAKKALPIELRETAFAAATDLVFSDGVITEEEENFLGNLWGSLDISDEIGQKILEVMEILHRG